MLQLSLGWLVVALDVSVKAGLLALNELRLASHFQELTLPSPGPPSRFCEQIVNNPPQTLSTASRSDPSSTCVYTLSVVSTMA